MWFSCFPVSPGSAEAQVIWRGILKRLMIAYFVANISVKKYQNPFMCVKAIASQRWDVFWDTVYNVSVMREGVKGAWSNAPSLWSSVVVAIFAGWCQCVELSSVFSHCWFGWQEGNSTCKKPTPLVPGGIFQEQVEEENRK